MTAPAETALEIAGPALLTRWSARGLDHTLEPVQRGEFWRDANGGLHFAALPGTRYRLRVAGKDVKPPAFDGLWPGRAVTVTCAQRLAVVLAAGTDSVTLERDPAAGSVQAETFDGRGLGVAAVNGRDVTVESHPGGPVSVFYRPVLAMLVTNWSAGLEEWDGLKPWSLDLEEV